MFVALILVCYGFWRLDSDGFILFFPVGGGLTSSASRRAMTDSKGRLSKLRTRAQGLKAELRDLLLFIFWKNDVLSSPPASCTVLDRTREILAILKEFNGFLPKPMPLPFSVLSRVLYG